MNPRHPNGPSDEDADDSEYVFYSNCVNWDRSQIDELHAFIDSKREVSLATLRKHLGRQLDELAENLGYTKRARDGLTLAKDWAISFVRGRCFGQTAYAVVWSGIEYVFVHRKASCLAPT